MILKKEYFYIKVQINNNRQLRNDVQLTFNITTTFNKMQLITRFKRNKVYNKYIKRLSVKTQIKGKKLIKEVYQT